MKRVVLCRPSGPRNVGMILRVCVNFGPCELYLVAPEKPSLLIHPEFDQMSHGVENPRELCRVVATLEEALADCTHSIGFTARARMKRSRVLWHEVRNPLIATASDEEEMVALVFGNEVTGLTSEESGLLQELVHIPTSAEHTSLNLAMAVGIVLGGVSEPHSQGKYVRSEKPISGEAREFLKRSLKHVLAGKVARTDSARADVEAMVDRVFSRAPIQDRDARAWHLVLRSLGNELTPKDLGLTLHERRGRRQAALEKAKERDKDSLPDG